MGGAREGSSLAIEVCGLEKTFKGRRRVLDLVRFWRKPKQTDALRGVDLRVGCGELVTLLGPNGAGKTTLLKVIATLVTPSKGSAFLLGEDIRKDRRRARSLVGYVLAEERSFYWRLTCRDNLRFFAVLQGLTPRAAKDRIEELALLLGLIEHLDREFADLSTGQRQRVAIARGLIADPPVLLFDEATRSLDPGRAKRLRRIIREILVDRAQKSVLFATHDLEEAREISDRVVLMREGRIDCEGKFDVVEARVTEVFDQEAAEEDQEYENLFPQPVASDRGAA